MTITLSDHQWDAVKATADWFKNNSSAALHAAYDPFTKAYFGGLGHGQDWFLGGFAGTGKSTILPPLIEEMGLSPSEVGFVAPTGKAAKVMTTKLADYGINEIATTIHKLIYTPKMGSKDAVAAQLRALEEHLLWLQSGRVDGKCAWSYEVRDMDEGDLDDAIRRNRIDLARLMQDDDGPKFLIKPREEIRTDMKLLVVDEASMVGLSPAYDLATLGIPILAIGDPGQLPPVEEDYGFNVKSPDAFLTEIHRQAKDNPIIHLATLARAGEELPYGDYGNGVKVVPPSKDDMTLNVDEECMVLCGTHKKRWGLTNKIRKALGIDQSGPAAGEPLICRKNSNKYATMVNGAIYENVTDQGRLVRGNVCLDLTLRDPDTDAIFEVQAVQALFEEHVTRQRGKFSGPARAVYEAQRSQHQFDFGHVLTGHSAQGSQWDRVAVHNESGVFGTEASRWLYTAVTRAAEELIVVQ